MNHAETVMLTVTTEKGDFLVMGAADPRPRVSAHNRYHGVEALASAGKLNTLPLVLKFLGGLRAPQEKPGEAALREFGEEMAPTLARQLKPGDLTAVYTMQRPDEFRPQNGLELVYYHAHLAMPYDALKAALKPAEDVLAAVIVRPKQVMRGPRGYQIKGPPVEVVWREKYAPIPYEEFGNIPHQLRDLFDIYNERGATDPMVGVAAGDLTADTPLYAPSDIDPRNRLTTGQFLEGKGGAVPDGAIFTQLVMPLLAAKGGWRGKRDANHYEGARTP